MRKIKQVAVIGSGVMGSGIAGLFASTGIKTLLLDIVPLDLSEEEKKNPTHRNRIVYSGYENLKNGRPAALMQPGDAEYIRIGNLEDDFEKLAGCDWIIEVVVEDLRVKQALLKRIEKVRKSHTIVSSNTSGIPLKQMSEGLSADFRQHFMGTHFFNPVRHMHLLELIPGEETLPEIISFIADFGAHKLGKGIVWAKDTPNFISNRIGAYGIQCAMHTLVEQGLRIPEADAMLGPVLGRPKTANFKTADLVGLDTLGHVVRTAYDLVVDDECRDTFTIPHFVSKLISNKYLGNKTDGGFYKSIKGADGKIKSMVINPETGAYETFSSPEFPCLKDAQHAGSLSDKIKIVLDGNDRGAKYAWLVLARFLIYAANRIPEIADTVVEIDNALKWGYNHQLGPFETWDAIGVPESVARMEREGMTVPLNVKNMLKDGTKYFYRSEKGHVFYYDFGSKAYKEIAVTERAISLKNLTNAGNLVASCPSANLIDLEDGVFCCEFTTKMNALNRELIDFIHDALDYVDSNGAGLIIGNQPSGGTPAFSAGANLVEILTAAQKRQFDDIRQMIRRLQRAVQRLQYEAFPVVSAPYGLALGGGCEIGLGADRMVAHAELYMGLVEIGVGLLPAGGGCLNTWKRYVGTVPSNVKDTDLMKLFIPIFQNIAMAKVSTSAADAQGKGYLGARDRVIFNRDHLIGEAKKEVLKMLSDGYTPPLKGKIKVPGKPAQKTADDRLSGMVASKKISEYDAYLGKCIAYVLSGGDVTYGTFVEEDVILDLEAATFLDLLKEKKTLDRIEHMLNTGKPLRN